MVSTGLGYLKSNALGALALFIALGGTGYAAAGGFTRGGQLQACVSENGSLTLLKAGKHCKRSQKKVAWNQIGPAGPKGASGATGAVGATGAQGPQGTALAYAHVTKEATLDPGNSRGVVDVRRNSEFPSGYYCLYGNFTPHVGTASLDYDETSGNEHVTAIGFSSGGFSGCPTSATGAPVRANVLVHDSTSKLADAGFFIIIN